MIEVKPSNYMNIDERFERIERLLLHQSKEVFNTKEAASFLGISETRLYHLMCEKQIPHYKRSSNNFFKKAELESWMTTRRVPTDDEIKGMTATHIVTYK